MDSCVTLFDSAPEKNNNLLSLKSKNENFNGKQKLLIALSEDGINNFSEFSTSIRIAEPTYKISKTLTESENSTKMFMNKKNVEEEKNQMNLKNTEEKPDSDFETNEEEKKPKIEKNTPQQKWLKELANSAELETMSILYAKSILEPSVSNGLKTRVTIRSSNCSDSNLPPLKPQRSIPPKTEKSSLVLSCNRRIPINDNLKVLVEARKPINDRNSLLSNEKHAKNKNISEFPSREASSNRVNLKPTNTDLTKDLKAIKSNLRPTKTPVQKNENEITEKNNLDGFNKGISEVDLRKLTPIITSSIYCHSTTVCLPSTSSAMTSSLIFHPSTTISIASSTTNNCRRQSSGILDEALNRPRIISDDSFESFAEKVTSNKSYSRFALSLPNTTSMSEQFQLNSHQVPTNIKNEDTCNLKKAINSLAEPTPTKCCESNIKDYSELPLCEQVYEPKIKYRAQKRSKISGFLINKHPPTFRHSIRVNNDEEEEKLEDSGTNNQEFLNQTITPSTNLQISNDNENKKQQRVVHFPEEAKSEGEFVEISPSKTIKSSSASPKSSHSSTNVSLDSGQGSGEPDPLLSKNLFLKSKRISNFYSNIDELEERSKEYSLSNSSNNSSISSEFETFSQINKNNLLNGNLPAYVKIASMMDNILRTNSTVFSLLDGRIDMPKVSCDLFHKTGLYIQMLRQSSCAKHFNNNPDIELVICAMRDAERDAALARKPLIVSDYFTIVVRKMLEQTLLIFVRIVCNYLSECSNKDKLLQIAMKHLVHILLFGDELCLEAIRNSAIDNIISFCRLNSTPSDSLKLLLRVLAILCGTSKGCLQLLSLGGLDIVVSVLCDDSKRQSQNCSVEAAGVLTQLITPGHAYVKLNQTLQPVVLRLLELVDSAKTCESLLLCAAALANLSLQTQPIAVTELLYQHNAILRLVKKSFRNGDSPTTLNKSPPKKSPRNRRLNASASIFVQEQVVTIFGRMAQRGYECALIAQGAIPALLQMLRVEDRKHGDYCRRIRYKAAVCLGTLAASGVGLKALYENHGYVELCEVIDKESEHNASSPLLLICSSIKQKIENKYQIESCV